MSQGSVLIHYNGSSSGNVAGHVTPIPWSMSEAATGDTSAMVTFDPLAEAAAMFIEQYDAHVTACKATCGGTDATCSSGPGEAITPSQQLMGQYLLACSTPTGRRNFLAGMKMLLNIARRDVQSRR